MAQILKNYTLIHDPQDVPAVVQALDRVPEFALDLETTGLEWMRHDIHGVSLATADQEWYVTLGAEHALFDLLPWLVKDKLVIGHNLPFDMHFLHRKGISLPTIFDTFPGQFLVDENQDLGLKDLGHTKLGLPEMPDFKDLLRLGKKLTGKKRLEDVSIYDLPLELVAEYAARDTRINYDLKQKTAWELEQEGMYDFFTQIEMPFAYVLTHMEETGFFIDQERMAAAKAEFTKKRDDALNQFLDIAGDINVNSPDQLAEYFYGALKYKTGRTTDTGKPSTDIIAMYRMVPQDKNGAVAALLEYRKNEKMLGTYITSFEERLVNGRLYGNFHIGPVTGRLSSDKPNLQNIPAHGEAGAIVREFFAAPLYYLFWDADYSQLELRLAAHYTQDPTLMRIFLEGLDPHQITADGIGSPRHIGKTINFSWFYGAGARKVADTIEKTGKPRPNEKDVAKWLLKFEETYPGAKRWKDSVLRYARELGYVRTIAGRKRHLPDLYSFDKALRGSAERQAVNAIIQGSAGDIIKWAMLQIFPLLPRYDARISAQVHDEICGEVHKDAAAEFTPIVQELMEAGGTYYNLRLPLVAEPGTGPNWANAKH